VRVFEINRKNVWRSVFICLIASLSVSLQLASPAAQFADLTAEIEINNWSYWFFEDLKGVSARTGMPPKSVFVTGKTARFVVGTNTWMMEGGFYNNANVTRWFTGTNIIERAIITAQPPDPPKAPLSLVVLSPPVGHEWRKVHDSSDGNPGRPVRVEDLMEVHGKIGWLAFFSGASLKRADHQIFPPDDIWKERCACSGVFIDKTVVFEDGLGLPKSMDLYTEKGQLIFQYQVRQSTNVLGWNFPLEFYLVQYGPAHWPRTNSWEVELTAKGRLISIGRGDEHQVTPEVPNAPGK